MINESDAAKPVVHIVNQDLDKTGFVIADDTDYSEGNTGLVEISSYSGSIPVLRIDSQNNMSHIHLTGDPTVASSADGNIWFDGTNLKMNKNGTEYNIDMTAV